MSSEPRPERDPDTASEPAPESAPEPAPGSAQEPAARASEAAGESGPSAGSDSDAGPRPLADSGSASADSGPGAADSGSASGESGLRSSESGPGAGAGGSGSGRPGTGAAAGPGSGSGSGSRWETGPGSGPAAADGTEQGTLLAFADRCYRSPAALAGGVVLLLIVLWLGCDALIGGSGRMPWIALSGMVFVIPLVVAFTLRPAVYANEQRLRVRNPFRTITAPWGTVETVRSGYSSEFIADGAKYQLWSIPVSLRARKRASRRTERAARATAAGAGGRQGGRHEPRPSFGGGGLLGFGGSSTLPSGDDQGEARAPSDQAIDELRELAAQHGEKPHTQGRVTIRWAYEIAAPAAVGAIALAVLMATR